MTLTIVGEAPGGSGEEARTPLEPTGYTGARLAAMLGLSASEYIKQVERHNLFQTPDEGRRWNSTSAMLNAIGLLSTFTEGSKVVLLGTRVAKAFTMDEIPLFTWSRWDEEWTSGANVWMARVPHPSGRNRLLNDEDMRQRMSLFLREALELS